MPCRSYGGMLSAWFRIRYPWMVDGSIAASAPVLQFTGLTGPKAYNHIITNTFRNASVACAEGVFKSWDMIKALSVADMNRIFTPCTPITSQDEVRLASHRALGDAVFSMCLCVPPR